MAKLNFPRSLLVTINNRTFEVKTRAEDEKAIASVLNANNALYADTMPFDEEGRPGHVPGQVILSVDESENYLVEVDPAQEDAFMDAIDSHANIAAKRNS